MRPLGARGEDIAAAYLRKEGCRILKRNYKVPAGEIDIIAEDHGMLVFVEVKARSGGLFGSPEEAVDRKKQSRIINAALYYMSRLKNEMPSRFDIIALRTDAKEAGIEHIRDAFEL